MTVTAARPSPGRDRRALVVGILRHTGSALVVLLVVGLLALAAALSVVPKAAGARTLTVLSGSMAPAIPARSIVVVRPVEAGDVRVGDIITFVQRSQTGVQRGGGAGQLVTHRVVRVVHGEDGTTFATKGDANNATDLERVQPANVIGRVWYHVPYVGAVRDGLFATPLGLYTIAGLLLIVGISLLGHAFWGPDDPDDPGGTDGTDGTDGTGAKRAGTPPPRAAGTAAGDGLPAPRPPPRRGLFTVVLVAAAGALAAGATASAGPGTAAWLRSTAVTPTADIAGDQAPAAARVTPAPSPSPTAGPARTGAPRAVTGTAGPTTFRE